MMADHFDAEVTCEEYYCDDFVAWDELLAAEEIFDAVVKSELTSENSVVQ